MFYIYDSDFTYIPAYGVEYNSDNSGIREQLYAQLIGLVDAY
jgi:hypothetical protein